MALEINNLRQEYDAHVLDEQNVSSDPIKQFEKWFEEALSQKVTEPNAMTLSTVKVDGKPSARIVLLKGVDEKGFVFFTNYESNKGRQIGKSPFAALTFWWQELHRQVRVEGSVYKITPEESKQYFQSRPKGSQIGAWASPQSRVIPDRTILEDNVKELQEKYTNTDLLPRPEHWGGYRVVPELIEFWQGRESRLHDRLCFTKAENGSWKMDRLAP